jgi:hypothetical protein
MERMRRGVVVGGVMLPFRTLVAMLIATVALMVLDPLVLFIVFTWGRE